MDLERRVEKLEAFAEDAKERLVRIETHLDGMATKADLAALEATILKWFIATAVALTGLAFAAGRYVH
ncbi:MULTISPECIES: hypothetical protein [unclassified Duganella]|uniref:hypothetical protein n=1 Tax=unclassified Duganella TaxID=2636909 RepID=UPI000891604C|nr:MULTISPECIES: hypothetical protein [unclassified Duganella]SDG19859.1 hypothetical protein SAMN05216320_103212 [Duganella sp. OV458]SDJ28356.1 hypothetical protein SAMN05428973_103274 [Duganella sp. OV510]